MRHLSDYMLDSLAAGRSTPEIQAHLAGCLECQARWAQTEKLDSYLRLNARFGTVRQFVLRDVAAARRRRRMQYLVYAPLAAAAAIALVVMPRYVSERPASTPSRAVATAATEAEHHPAGPSMEVVRVDGPGAFHPGDRAVIRVNPAGLRQALVMGFDETGRVSQIWPASGESSGPIPSGRHAVLTPGSWAPWKSTRVEVFLSNDSLSSTDVQTAFNRAHAAAPKAPIKALRIADIPHQQARLSSFITVEPSRGAAEPLGAPR